MAPEPIACTEDGDTTWVEREGCTKAAARRFCAEGAAHLTLSDWKVTAGHIRQLVPGDCPVHPNDDRDEWDENEDCRCGQIDEGGWWDECSRSHPQAVSCWRVDFKPSTEEANSGV